MAQLSAKLATTAVWFLSLLSVTGSSQALLANPQNCLSSSFNVNSPALLSTKRQSSSQLYVFERMSEDSITAILTARGQATKFHLAEAGNEVMMAGCISNPGRNKALDRTFNKYSITWRRVQQTLADIYSNNDENAINEGWLSGFRAAKDDDNDRPFSNGLKQTFISAGRIADQMESQYVEPHHLFLALLDYKNGKGDEDTAATIENDVCACGGWAVLVKMEVFDEGVTALDVCQSLLKNLESNAKEPELVVGSGGSGKTPTLEEFGTDLTAQAQDGLLDPVYGRDEEIKSCVRTLLRRRKNNVCLIGEPGVGKTAIAEGVSQLLVDTGKCPSRLRNYRMISLDLAQLVAGTRYRGEFEERLQALIKEATNEKSPPTILFLDELHNLVGAGGAEGGMDAGNILKPALARGQLQLIGATTIMEYRKYIEKDAALERRFQPLMIKEPTVDQTVSILKAVKSNYERHHGVKYSPGALDAAAALSERYINDRFLPDKALDLLDEAGARCQLDGCFNDAAEVKHVTEHTVAEVISEWSGIPMGKLETKEMDRLQALEIDISRRVKGQRRAVRGVSRAIRRARAGLRDPKRPVASFLFCGPTGTGKTELCKTLAETYFGSEKDMIRIDMSEYMEKHSVSRLTGPPPGYIGYEDGGQLTEAVRRTPHSVVLLDEIEKAHGDVLNILLQVLEDGILTDGKGRTINFKNAILVMTSNVGSMKIVELARDFKEEETASTLDEQEDHQLYPRMASVVMEELEATMKPELLNRVDEIVVFSPLSSDELEMIARMIVHKTIERAEEEHNMELDVAQSLIAQIIEEGVERGGQFGARPMRRAAQRFVEDTLSEAIVQGFIKEGDNVCMGISSIQELNPQNKHVVVVQRLKDGAKLEVEVENSDGSVGWRRGPRSVHTTQIEMLPSSANDAL